MRCWKIFLWLALMITMAVGVQAQTADESFAALDRGDYPAAFTGFKRLAENGEANSQGSLAIMYAEGWGTQKNERQAYYWYRQSAEQGNWLSQYNLGEIYAFGNGVPEDMQKAYFWFWLACNNTKGKQKFAQRCGIAESLVSLEKRVAVQTEARN